MPETIRRAAQDGLQFADAGMAQRPAFRLDGALLDGRFPPLPNWSTRRNCEKRSTLNGDKSWDWESAGRIWPYLHMKWILARLQS